MIWQLILFVMLVLGGLGVLNKHLAGNHLEAGNLASGMAGFVGILLMITGFVTLRGDDKPATRTVARHVVAAVPAPAPTMAALPAPTPQPLPAVIQPPVALLPPIAPVTKQYDLGAPGSAYQRVEAIMMRYKDQYQHGINEIQQTELRFARGRELCQAQSPQYGVVARLGSVTTNKDGDASVTFNTPSGMELIPGGTFQRGSPMHTSLMNVAPGSPVAIFFTFDSDETGKDCFHSHRWTEHNNMSAPQWDVNVLSITPVG